MTRFVFLDRHGEDRFIVRWIVGAQPIRTRILDSRDAAERFANGKMGKRGTVVSTLDMTADQLAAHLANQYPRFPMPLVLPFKAANG